MEEKEGYGLANTTDKSMEEISDIWLNITKYED